MAHELRLQTPYLTLAARAWGSQAGSPVLALHGWLDNAASFVELAPLLPSCHIVALDLPGHGLSDWRPAGIHYHFSDFTHDVLMAADALDWKRFTLLGHSLGASIACFVAAVAPERVAQLALIESLGPLTASPSEAPAQLAISLRQTQALHQKQKPPPIYAHRKAAIQARQQAGVSYLAAATLAERGLKTVDNGFSWRSDPWLTVKSPVYLCEEQVLAFLAAIQAPTLLIQAESGYLVKRKTTAKRQQQVRHLKCKVLAGNHHLHLEDPAPTAAALREFFSLQKSLY